MSNSSIKRQISNTLPAFKRDYREGSNSTQPSYQDSVHLATRHKQIKITRIQKGGKATMTKR